MHDLRQRHCPISTPTHCKKRVATAWLTHHAVAGASRLWGHNRIYSTEDIAFGLHSPLCLLDFAHEFFRTVDRTFGYQVARLFANIEPIQHGVVFDGGIPGS